MKTRLCGMNRKEIEDFLVQLGYPKYRGKQVFSAIYKRRSAEFAEMTDLPAALRQHLSQVAEIGLPEVLKKQTSSQDGTIKLLLRLSDGHTVEAVSMVYLLDRSRSRLTFCLSSQVGCPVGCPFCATGQSGFVRNLTAAEMMGQLLVLLNVTRQSGDLSREEIKTVGINVVFMGMGEPMLNLEEVLKAGRLMHDPEGTNISWRRITISTSGVVPGILRLIKEGLPVNLAVSLHAADNPLRDRLVPINRRYPLEQLIAACRDYIRASGRRLTFEYVLLPEINDRPEQAHQLADVLTEMPALVNLIPVNPTAADNYQKAVDGLKRKRENNRLVRRAGRRLTPERVKSFVRILRSRGVGVTVREGRGSEISAACGQLRSRDGQERKGHGVLGED